MGLPAWRPWIARPAVRSTARTLGRGSGGLECEEGVEHHLLALEIDAFRPGQQLPGLFPYLQPAIKMRLSHETGAKCRLPGHDLGRHLARAGGTDEAGEPPEEELGERAIGRLALPARGALREPVKGHRIEPRQRCEKDHHLPEERQAAILGKL